MIDEDEFVPIDAKEYLNIYQSISLNNTPQFHLVSWEMRLPKQQQLGQQAATGGVL